MQRPASLAVFSALLAAPLLLCAPVRAAAAEPKLTVALDASQAPQKIYHIKERIDGLTPGPFTFDYPKWIPGYHGPVGPIEGVVSLNVSAGGQKLEWRRDLVDMYSVHTTLPAGSTSAEVDFDVVGAPSHNGMNEPESTSQLVIVEYSNFVVYPHGEPAEDTPVDASLTLPAGWTFGTALPVASQSANTITFKSASLYTVVDSPIVAGAHEKAYPLGPTEELDVSADSAAAAEITPAFLTGMKHLVREGPALYGGRHYRDYHFLLTLSDPIGFEGIEHHESSDDRADESYASEDGPYFSLLPHEYSHSWNGKYRRPADLATADYNVPEQTDLLWVYEGLNEYNGEKLATRARLNNVSEERDTLASTAAAMEYENGRDWRPIRDTADGAPFLYVAPGEYYNLRRSAGDFYSEGDLIWLDADVTIQKLTGGTKSLDDFCKLWGNGSDTTDVPVFMGYDRALVLALLNKVVPYDWDAFFKKRIDDVSPHAPLGGIENGGYRLVFTDTPSAVEKKDETDRHSIDAEYSLGLLISAKDGKVSDVLTNSPAFAAGFAPDDTIVAIDGRKFSSDVLTTALKAHKGSASPISFIVSDEGDYYRTLAVADTTGPRYPHLEKIAGAPDLLDGIFAPKTFVPSPEPSVTPAAR
jgi:predicted metalloprotease with PDZ domain